MRHIGTIFEKILSYWPRFRAVSIGGPTEAATVVPVIDSGDGAPTEAAQAYPNGSVYLRRDGGALTTIYKRVSGAWISSGTYPAGFGPLQAIDMAGAAHAIVWDTASSGQTKGTGNVYAIDANGTGGGTSAQTLTLPSVVDGRELILINIGEEPVVLSGASGSSVVTTDGVIRLVGSTLAASWLTENGSSPENNDRFVVATIAVANASGGATTAALTLQLYRQDGVTPIRSARQVLIRGTLAQYNSGGAVGSQTYGSATVGSIIGGGTGYSLIETNSSGAFACTVTDAADETLYFSAQAPSGVSDVAKGVFGVISNSDSATWAA